MSKPYIQPYVFFNGRCEEAIEFYKKAVGAEVVMLMRYDDSPEPHQPGMVPDGWEKKVMHSTLRVGGSEIMASDGNCEGGGGFEGFFLSLSVPDEAAAKQAYEALAEGGAPFMPLAKTFWSPCFGMLKDRFGMGWMVSVPGSQP
jgi:PhnB protein